MKCVQTPYRTHIHHRHAPDYIRYPYIMTGYRLGGDWARCLASLFEWHAETTNAWTMVVGCIVSTGMLVHVLIAYKPTAVEAAPFVALGASVLMHAPLSVAFHLMRGMDLVTYNLLRRLDQSFIFVACVLITLSMSMCVLSPRHALANTIISVYVAWRSIAKIWRLKPQQQRNRKKVALSYGWAVAGFLLPMAVQSIQDARTGRLVTTINTTGTAVSLVVGAVVFATGIPERLVPYYFDRLGSSHNWMHVSAITANLFEYGFLIEMLMGRRDQK